MKKLFLLICMSMSMTMFLAACGNNASSTNTESDSEATEITEEQTTSSESEVTGLTAGVYSYVLVAEGRGELYNFINFYENGVFYASMYDGAQYEAGFYEIIDETAEYDAETNGETDMIQVDKVIVMTKPDGSEYLRVAYDTENDLLGDVEVMYTLEFAHELDPDPSKTEESGVTLYEYMLGEDEYSVVAIKHNGTFEDSTGTIIVGTWMLDNDIYTLTDEVSGDSYTITLLDDGNSAEYVGLDGTKAILNLLKKAEALITFTGATSEAAYGDMSVIINCFDGGAAEMVVTYAGTESDFEGTWEMAETQTQIALELDGTTYEAAINMDDHSFAFDITLGDGTGEVIFEMSNVDTK